MSICPFGKYKGKNISEIDRSYLVFLLGYVKDGICQIPYKQVGWSYRYPEFYMKLLENISKCIRCDNVIDKTNENKHLNILCNSCYVKHKNGIHYRKCKNERGKNKSNEDVIYDNIVKCNNLVKINRVNSEGHWEQDVPCGICGTKCYSLGKPRREYYNICQFCLQDCYEKIAKQNKNFNSELYKSLLEQLNDRLSKIKFINSSSNNVTQTLTKECITLGQKLGFTYILEKKFKHPFDNYKSVFYDIEFTCGKHHS